MVIHLDDQSQPHAVEGNDASSSVRNVHAGRRMDDDVAVIGKGITA